MDTTGCIVCGVRKGSKCLLNWIISRVSQFAVRVIIRSIGMGNMSGELFLIKEKLRASASYDRFRYWYPLRFVPASSTKDAHCR